MALRSMRRGKGVRAILAGGLLALGLFTVAPVSAAEPILNTTSVESGWSAFNDGVAADFDEPLDAVASSASLVDLDTALPVLGTTQVINNGILFTPNTALAEDGTRYEVTFSPVSFDGITGQTIVRQFRVDTKVPDVPRINTPSAMVSSETGPLRGLKDGTHETLGADVQIAIAAPGSGATVEGSAADKRGLHRSTKATSGVHEIHLRFYDPFSAAEATDLRVVIDMACSGQCSADVESWSATTDHLPPGYWTMRAVAFDLAGNASAPSGPISFLTF